MFNDYSSRAELISRKRRYFSTIAHTKTIILSFIDALYRRTFLEKIEDRRFFAKTFRYCELYLEKRTLLNYDNVVQMPISKMLCHKNPIDVPEFIRLKNQLT